MRRPLEPGQYTSTEFTDLLAEHEMVQSLSRPRQCWDNAMAEALNGSFKAELVHLHGAWRARHQLEVAIIEWIDWYNASRLHSGIGDIPPFEHEAHWYGQNTPALTAETQ